MGSVERPDRRLAVEELLRRGYVCVYVNCDADGVDVPTGLRGHPSLVMFHIGYDMPTPIPDLEIDDLGIRCTLRFGDSFHYCEFPWGAVHGAFLAATGEGTAWIRGRDEIAAAAPPVEPEPPPPAPRGRGHLRLVD